jgi:hypothetical protein
VKVCVCALAVTVQVVMDLLQCVLLWNNAVPLVVTAAVERV